MSRTSVNVIVPFRGEAAELEELRARLLGLRLRPGDSVVIVDNTPRHEPVGEPGEGPVTVLRAAEQETPAYARNRGAAQGDADWLVFLDADTLPPPDLLDRYFEPPPGERTALIAGGVADEPVPEDGGRVARYAYIRALSSQDETMGYGRWSFPQTTNAACRRKVFEELGGFEEGIRAAEDADLAYRMKEAGWEIERRDRAAVVHRNRQTARSFVAQKLLHGSGGAWLARRYPGAFPARRRPGLVWWGLRRAVRGLVSAARRRDRDTALWAVFEPLELLSFEFGRSLPNQRPLRWPWRRSL